MIKRPKIVAQQDWPLLTADEFQATFDQPAKKGFAPRANQPALEIFEI
jgi:hypothetical protein